MNPRVTSFAEALAKLPLPDGRRSMFIVDDPNLALKLYAPRGTDPQTPHTRDEIYIIASGSGEFLCDDAAEGGGATSFAPGNVLFAAAGVPHRFENFSDDFSTWVMFYGPPVLYTERLTLRLLTGDDFDAYARIHADDETQRFLHGKGMTRLEAYRSMSMLAGQWQLRGYGFWGVFENETNELVGRVGFHNPEGWPGFELGWTIARERWGRGYATEAARAIIDYGFRERNLNRIDAGHFGRNPSSGRVMQKVGMQYEGRLRQSIRKWDEYMDVDYYAILRSDWAAAQTR